MNKSILSLAGHLLVSAFFCIVLDISAVSVSASPLTQSVIDDAMAQPLLDYRAGNTWNPNAGCHPDVVKSAHAFYFLAVAAYYDSAAASGGTLCKDRVLAHFRSVTTGGGTEPVCGNPLNSFADCAVAQSILMMRYTSSVWAGLTTAERTKADWLMKALAVTGNWGFNDANNFNTGLDNAGNFNKAWNPNFTQGYLGVMIACGKYFTAATLDSHLTTFSYTTYINQFTTYNWTRIKGNWSALGQSLMENGGSDAYGGSGAGVKVAFNYQGSGSSDPNGIFYRGAVGSTDNNSMYTQTVVNNGAGGNAYIITPGSSSPVLGQVGMCKEFQSFDGGGQRSDANYCFHGWMNNVVTRSTMHLLTIWGGANQTLVETRMNVGTTDLIYKLQKGYHSWSNGHVSGDFYESNLIADDGYLYDKELWNKVKGNARAGTWSLRGVMTSTASSGSVSQVVSGVASNTTYVAYLFIKGSGSVILRVRNGNNGTQITSVRCDATSIWTKVTTPSFSTGSNTQLTVVVQDSYGIAGTAYLDDLFLGVSGSTNLIPNYGFESGNISWTNSNTAIWSIGQF